MNDNEHRSILINKIAEIKCALNMNLYNCAIAVSLTLPDICGKAKYPQALTAKRYKAWFDEHAKKYFTIIATKLPEETEIEYIWLTSDECYALRCAVLHAGNYKVTNIDLAKIYIHAHKRNGSNYSKIIRDNKYADWDVIALCENLCKAAEEYYDSTDNKERFDLDEVRIDTW